MKARKSSEPSKSRQIATEVSVLEFYNWGTHTTQQREVWNERKGERSFKPKENELVTSLMHLRISFEDEKGGTSLQWFCLTVQQNMLNVYHKPQNPLRRADGRKFSCTWLQRIRLISSKKHLGQVHPLGGIFRFSAKQFSILT